MICIKIDELTPCLKRVDTGDIVETEVVRIRRKSFLAKLNKRTGWHVNWGAFDASIEIYALVVKGTFDIQGLVAVGRDEDLQALHIYWACAAPQNDIYYNGKKEYSGVGGHLFAVAGEISKKNGFDGYVYGEAANAELFNYYCENFGALPTTVRHPYGIFIPDYEMEKIMEVYDYEWTDEEF